jgi:hypothetical protein
VAGFAAALGFAADCFDRCFFSGMTSTPFEKEEDRSPSVANVATIGQPSRALESLQKNSAHVGASIGNKT